jgi:GT2 family glycosyltransferase/glycosyltransferase involved in cell wall biosynthesis
VPEPGHTHSHAVIKHARLNGGRAIEALPPTGARHRTSVETHCQPALAEDEAKIPIVVSENEDSVPPTACPDAPSSSMFGTQFIEELYIALNPDVADAVRDGKVHSGLDHWLKHGRKEAHDGTRASILTLPHSDQRHEDLPAAVVEAEANDLDLASYIDLNPDLSNLFGTDLNAAREHWLKYGRQEGRISPGIAPFRRRSIDLARMMAKPFGINVFGPFLAKTGLGTAARNILHAVKASGIPFEVWNIDTTLGPARVAELDRSRPTRYRINLILANADQMTTVWQLFPAVFFDDAYNLAVWQWELPAFRPDWFGSYGAIDEVWTNSQFQVDAIRAISPVPVTNIPLPIPVCEVGPGLTRADLQIDKDQFVFLAPFDVGSTSDRKNPFAAIEAFRAAFANEPGVILVLKYHSGRHERGLAIQLSRALAGLPNVRIIPEALSVTDMASLRALSDCLISPHRSEGFGLNIAEFLALGKSVVATAYSGNMDFFDETVGFPVDYELVEISEQTGPYPVGYIWANPSIPSLIEQMRLVFKDRTEAGVRGRRAAERMKARFSPEFVGHLIERRLRAIGLDIPQPEFANRIGRSRNSQVPSLCSNFLVPSATSQRAPKRVAVLSVVVPVYNVDGELLRECIESVRRQTYPYWELCLCNDGSTKEDTCRVLDSYRGISPYIRICDLTPNGGISAATNKAVEMATGGYVVLLDNDDRLDSDALMEVANAIEEDPSADVIYTDELKIDLEGNVIDHFYKPDWSPEHLESVMYMLHMITIRKSLLLKIGGLRREYDGAQDYDLMLRCSRVTDRIKHVRRALYHWRAIPGSAASEVDAKPAALTAGLRALADHVQQKFGNRASAEKGLTVGTFRVRREVVGLPRVTLLILAGNGRITLPGRGEFLMVENLVESILKQTSYSNYDVVVVDDCRLTEQQIDRFQSRGVRVENYVQSGQFNFAHKANFAVRKAKTDLIVLLNDDMEVVNDEWLEALLEFAQDPEVGVVGARLLHASGTIQHAGIVLGVNQSAAHVYHSFPGDFVGYNGFTHIIRNYSAVTGACFATRKSVVMHVGGFDQSFATDFNDIDLCLKVREAGYRIVYTPHSTLYHFEGSSIRRNSQNPDEHARFCNRWQRYIDDDPYYNINLARDRVDFARRV